MSKSSIQSLLKRLGLYQRLKASFLYDLYWNITDSRVVDDRRREVDFYRTFLKDLKKGALIFDIGANEGYKTDIFLRLGARVVAVEPDKVNQDILKQRFLRLRSSTKPVVVVDKAVSDTNTTHSMWVDAPGSAKNTLSRKWVDALRADDTRFGQTLQFSEQREVQTTTLEELVREYGPPLFVKIDVEGHEPNVLRGLRRPVPFLSFEVNLPEFRPEGLECVELLQRLAPHGAFNYTVDCRHGFLLERWLEPSEFSTVLQTCGEKSIEVFWRTSA